MTSHRSQNHSPFRLPHVTREGVLTAVAAVGAAAGAWALCDVMATPATQPPAASSVQSSGPIATPLGDRDVHMVGQVVAVEPTSITTRGADGSTMTFAITPQTAQVSTDGDVNGSAFALNETVTILGTVRQGQPVATAVADQDASTGNAPPMDFVAAANVAPTP